MRDQARSSESFGHTYALRGLAGSEGESAHRESAGASTRFSSRGALPPVSAAAAAGSGGSASELAYGHAFPQIAPSPLEHGEESGSDRPMPPKSPSHVTPHLHPTKSRSHVTPHVHDSRGTSHETPHAHDPNRSVSYSTSKEVDFEAGDAIVQLGVGLQLKSGVGAVDFDASTGNLTVGDGHFNLHLLDANAVQGKSLETSGTGLTVKRLHHSHTSWQLKLPFIVAYFTSEWELHGPGWTATLTLGAGVGLRLKGPKGGDDDFHLTPKEVLVGAGVVAAILAAPFAAPVAGIARLAELVF